MEDTITVVTGLPRSGTSLVMQMLAAGGIAVTADDRRAADFQNPRGYFEDQRVKALKRDASWLGEAGGTAIKIVAPLLPFLPDGLDYRVVWTERSLEEVLASQRAMLQATGAEIDPAEETALELAFVHQCDHAREVLATRRIPVLELSHRAVIREPLAAAQKLGAFLGSGFDATAAAAAVDPRLHRQRGSS